MAKRDFRLITVRILPGNPPAVDLKTTIVSKDRGDAILWHCDPGHTWQVDYGKNSPFTSATFDPTNPCSGAARAGADEGYYKYTLTVDGTAIDPGTVVDQ